MHLNATTFDNVSTAFFRHGLEEANLQDNVDEETVRAWFDTSGLTAGSIREVYWIDAPFCFAVIEEDDGELQYSPYEVAVNSSDVRRQVVSSLEQTLTTFERNYAEFFEAMKRILELSDGVQLTTGHYRDVYHAFRHSSGYQNLYPVLLDSAVEQYTYDSLGNTTVRHSEYGNIVTDVSPAGELNAFINELLGDAEKQVDMDARDSFDFQKDRAYVNARTAVDQQSLSIRFYREGVTTPIDLLRSDMFDPKALGYLWYVIENGYDTLVIGETAAGKTTTLEALLFFTRKLGKVITVERNRQLSAEHENWVAGTYGRNIDGETLIQNALRQHPSYLAVDDMLDSGLLAIETAEAMTKGTSVLASAHADSLDTAIERVSKFEGTNLTRGLDVAIQLQAFREQQDCGNEVIVRQNTLLSEVADGHVTSVFEWDAHTEQYIPNFEGGSNIVSSNVPPHQIGSSSADSTGTDTEEAMAEITRRGELLAAMNDQDISEPSAVRSIITAYHDDPEDVIMHMHGNLETLL